MGKRNNQSMYTDLSVNNFFQGLPLLQGEHERINLERKKLRKKLQAKEVYEVELEENPMV